MKYAFSASDHEVYIQFIILIRFYEKGGRIKKLAIETALNGYFMKAAKISQSLRLVGLSLFLKVASRQRPHSQTFCTHLFSYLIYSNFLEYHLWCSTSCEILKFRSYEVKEYPRFLQWQFVSYL